MAEALRLGGDLDAIVELSRSLANERAHRTWTTLHVLAATCITRPDLLATLGADQSALEERLNTALEALPLLPGPLAPLAGSRPAPEVDELIEAVRASASEARTGQVSGAHVLMALSQQSDAAGALLRDFDLTADRIASVVTREVRQNAANDEFLPPLPPMVARLGRDLTAMAHRGELDPVIGREEEAGRVVAILSRRLKNTPVLVGEPGVGKTAIVEGLAARVAEGRVPPGFRAQRIFALDLALLVSGAMARGQFEERLYAVIREAEESNRKLVLFIDEIHMLVGAGAAEGGFDAASILKPAIARGTVSLIGATTPEAYRRYIEKDSALERRFSPVWIAEPSPADVVRILEGLRGKYEEFHHVRLDDEALRAAVRLSTRYITGRWLPDKAIDLIDEAAAAAALQSGGRNLAENGTEPLPTVSIAEVARVTSTITGIPLGRIEQSERPSLLAIEERIRRRFVGQDRAVELVAEAVRRNRVGLRTSRGPVGAFLFLGPSGVGKTELARQLADAIYGSSDQLLRLDMSEYMERHNVARLFGAPPGYVGYDDAGSLTEKVRRRPYQILLFDEIEKAHPDVLNALLQVLDAGRMTDNHGRVVDFRNTVIIMTSNLGTTDTPSHTRSERERATAEAIRRLPPEFRNRLDEVVVFEPLTPAQADQILGIYLGELRSALAATGVGFSISAAARAALLADGFDEATGARPLRGALERHVVGLVSRRLLAGDCQPGDRLAVGYKAGKYRVRRVRGAVTGTTPASPRAVMPEFRVARPQSAPRPSPSSAVLDGNQFI